MATDVLVAYATAHGSTRGVAERIAGRLGEAGREVVVAAVEEAGDVGAYDAVVFGSPCYNANWLPGGERFLDANAELLAARPLWLFSLASFGDRKRVIGPLMSGEPKRIEEFRQALAPRDYRVFAGVLVPGRWPWYGRLFYRALGGRWGDRRDWPEIDAWADGIAAELEGGAARR